MTGRGPLPLLGCGLLLLVGGCFRSFGLGVDGGADGGPLPADEGAPPIVEDGGPLPTDDGPPPSPDAGETPPLVLIAVDPTGPANDNMPVVTGTAVPNAEVILYASSACDEALEIGRGMAAPDGTFAIPVEVPDDAITVIHGVAAEAGRRPSLCSVEGLSYIEDSTPPPPPELLRTTPESPADEPMPVLEGEAEAGAVVEIFVDPLCTQPLAVTDATGEGTFEVALTVPEERETVLFGTATDAAGNRSECSSGLAYLEIGDPVGVVLFPPSVALTDEEEITVRGRIPVPLGVRRVRVDGERASTPNGWRDWTVDVDLEPGLNELPVTVELEGGRTLDGPIVEVVRRDLPTGRFLGAALDAGRGRLATIDNGADRLLAASLPTGALSVASGGEVGGGEPLTDPRAVTVDPAANRLYVALSERAVLEVNPVTGNRTELTGVNVGDGPAIGTIDDVAFGGGEVYVLDFGAPSVITEVDPTTGDRRELARYGMEVGARRPIRIAWDPVDDRVVALDVANREIVAVDADGTETVLSGPGLGLGLELPTSATAVDVDGLSGDILVLDGTRLLVVDPATGDRSLLPSANVVDWPPGTATGLAVDAGADRAFVVTSDGIVFRVELSTGERSVVRQDLVGGGAHFVTPTGVALADDGLLYVADLHRQAVLEVDRVAGDRRIVVESLSLQGPVGLAADGTGRRLFVTGRTGRLSRYRLDDVAPSVLVSGANDPSETIEHRGVTWDDVSQELHYVDDDVLYDVDPATGARTVVSGGPRGTGPSLASTRGLTRRGRALYASREDFVLSIDIATGTREEISGPNRGVGEALGPLQGLDAAPFRAVLWSASRESRVVEVELSSGNRTEIAKELIGRGPEAAFYFDAVLRDDGEVAWVAGATPPRLFAIDVLTLERVIVAW